MLTKVLVAEPDRRMRGMIRALLRGCDIAMLVLDDVSMLRARVAAVAPALIVLRIEPPGTAVCAALDALRCAGCDLPVIVLGSSAQLADKLVAFEAGADDYLVLPFEPMEFVVRVRCAIRRHAARAPRHVDRYAFGDIDVDFVTRRATRAGEDLGLRASEFALLEVFIAQPMRVLSRAEILARLGPAVAGRAERGLDVLIFRLRNGVEGALGDYRYIRTVRGRGYIFVPLGVLPDDDLQAPPPARV
ncbi:winged helix-turn-helix domain-containing protein [Burkholderia vietnamiensis]|uniref:winged helix-turn-helix domain-containing protein n=1 Tax=Burkholderia vietnamiensis TaxID=60552 RepID=UPI00075BD7B8|nr:response regulator transcription factor [Burkholderia vietnamiensis]KVE51310.1 two-component system response regulator [Burkholderia vietnamiensis]KVE83362.1 two-component system response regulator [Burkholderia vietnamiensis]MDN7926633.1 response regulator transcription factor [Burkholderia vietnamiensis]HDR9250597.1 response regulator transcription factor [Burkholderia vietnamiensis]